MEQRTITINGVQVSQHKTPNGVWVMDSIVPIKTEEQFKAPTILQAFGPKKAQGAPLKLVKRGGRRKLVRQSQYGKSLKKEYTKKERAEAQRLEYRNRKGCEQVHGETTNTITPEQAALDAITKALKSPCLHGQPCTFCS